MADIDFLAMHYETTNLRRKDRALHETDARLILHAGEYGVLSLQAPEGGGYGVPMNYVWDGADSLYLHCAGEGFKLCCLQAQPKSIVNLKNLHKCLIYADFTLLV